MPFGDSLTKRSMPFGDLNPKPKIPLHKEACLSAILTLNLKFPYINKPAFWRFPKKRSMPFGDLNPKPKINPKP